MKVKGAQIEVYILQYSETSTYVELLVNFHVAVVNFYLMQ